MASFKRLNLSIQSKLMLMLLLVAVTSIGVISWMSYSSARNALTEAAFNQLTTVRASKKIQIEAFFKTLRYQVSNLANDRMIGSATRELISGFTQLKTAKIPLEWDRKLEAFYQNKFLPKLASGSGQTPRIEAFLPEAAATRYAQYLYIANNPHFAAERHELEDAGDGSEFSKSHARYQAILGKFLLDFGYDDLILVDSRTGDVIYTFSKSPLFGTNLLDGPYSESGPGRLFRAIRKAGNQRKVQVVDFAPAPDALGKSVALMSAPIFDGPDQIGILLVQFPVDEINRVMTDNFGWLADGLGKTGEVYLVGPDMLMRSRSRLLHEDPKRYYEQLEIADYPPEDIDRVRRMGTATLAQSARTKAVEDALAGKTGTAVLSNYLHVLSLSSFAPVNVPGLHWVIVAEMDANEAFAALTALTRRMLVWSLTTILAVTIMAAVFGRRFVRPIFRLINGVNRLRAGERDVSIDIGSRDEFEDLGAAFNRIARRITSASDLLDQTTRERDELLDNMLPAAAAHRMKRNQSTEVDECAEISILFATLLGRGESGLSTGVQKSFGLLNDLTIAVDDAAERRGVEKVSSDGATYIACCGLSRQRLDHASRMVDFAQDMLKIVSRLHRGRQREIWVQIGIDSGSAAGGVVGSKRFSYHLAGEPMAVAGTLAGQAPPDAILVSRHTYALTQGLYRFGTPIQIQLPGSDAVAAWPLKFMDAREPEAPSHDGSGPVSYADAGDAEHASSILSSKE